MTSHLAHVFSRYKTPVHSAEAFKEMRLSEIRALDLQGLKWEIKYHTLNDDWFNLQVRREYDVRVMVLVRSIIYSPNIDI